MFNSNGLGTREKLKRMIKERERLQVSYSDEIGFEGSDQALFLAQITVYKAILELEAPNWAVKGDKQFRKYFKKTNQKLPDYDFYLLEDFLPQFWDSFRFILLRPDNLGSFKPIVKEELRSEFIQIFMKMPNKFRVNNGTELAAVNLMLEALQICLSEDKQLLAAPIFEVVLLIWYYYLNPIV
jgi:hypothetical protein